MFYYFLTLIIGAFISVMLTVNGTLTLHYGIYLATVLIHIVGLIAVTAIILIKKEHPFAKRLPLSFFLGGVIGVISTIFNVGAFGKISLTAITALCMLGMTLSSMLIDQYGLYGMTRVPITARKLPGIFFVLFGIFIMLLGSKFDFIPVVISFCSGVTIVLSRTYNARLSKATGLFVSSWYNYSTGLVSALIALLVIAPQELNALQSIPPVWWAFTGGLMGLVTVTLNSVVVVKIPALYMTVLLFIGQVFSSILIDSFLSGHFAAADALGGLCMIAGQILHVYTDSKKPSIP